MDIWTLGVVVFGGLLVVVPSICVYAFLKEAGTLLRQLGNESKTS